jgi:hypothetical protein
LFDVAREAFFLFATLADPLKLVLKKYDLALVALVFQLQVSVVVIGGDSMDLDFFHLAFVPLYDYGGLPVLQLRLKLALGFLVTRLGLLQPTFKLHNTSLVAHYGHFEVYDNFLIHESELVVATQLPPVEFSDLKHKLPTLNGWKIEFFGCLGLYSNLTGIVIRLRSFGGTR